LNLVILNDFIGIFGEQDFIVMLFSRFFELVDKYWICLLKGDSTFIKLIGGEVSFNFEKSIDLKNLCFFIIV
jgi:hypothetical protein